jgi:2-polyprenyl-3-methyl-5-hydroxy-6-metoxy-1,4-benzoquinol methylase
MDHPKTDYSYSQDHDFGSRFPSESAKKAARQYEGTINARAYAFRTSGTGTDRREKKCLLKALKLAKIPAGSSVLDCPCGPGRLFPILKKSGFRITGADISASMVDQARLYAGPTGINCLDEKDKLCLANLFDTGFEAGQFDAVICHRIFQYFSQPRERLLALTELRRISSGPLIVSFLCNWSIDALWHYIMRALRLIRSQKCRPISPLTFTEEMRSAGFKIKCWIAMRPFISKRWYAVLEPSQIPCNGLLNSISAYRRIIMAAGKRAAACVLAILLPFFTYNFFTHTDSGRFRQIEKIAIQYQDGDETFYLTSSSGLKTADWADKNIKLTKITQIDDDIVNDEKNDKYPLFLLSDREMKKLQSSPAIAKLEFVSEIKLGTNRFYLLRTPDIN